MKKGFTIIETLIYITLLSLLLNGAFITAYSLIESAESLQQKNIVSGEGNFFIQKLRWAFMNMQSITAPSEGSPNTTHANIIHYDGTIVTIRKNGSTIEMSEAGPSGTFYALTSQNVSVDGLHFSFIQGVSESPDGITATATINGSPFSLTKYIRK